MKTPQSVFFGLIVSLFAGVVFLGCEGKPTGIDPTEKGVFPAAPTNIQALVGDRKVILTWEFSDTTIIREFKIYRSTTQTSGFSAIGSTEDKTFTDQTVQNSVQYFYKITAVSEEDLEGLPTSVISATANVFSISIESGAVFTGTTDVKVTISAAASTAFMQLSNDSTFTSSTLEPFVSVTNWILPAGDGEKTVFAKFRDTSGNESSAPVHDSIILDTQATIQSITENTNGVQKQAGDEVHFTLNAGEAAGQAWASIEDGPQNIALFDNGTNGDQLPNDGVYEVDYIVPGDADVFEKRVIGTFIDRVNNEAAAEFSTTRLTIRRAPAAISLFPPVLEGDGKSMFKITWTPSQDLADFASYVIYRSTSPNITRDNATSVTSITSRSTTNFIDSGLDPNTTYFYRIFVVDFTNLATGSNEVSGTTLPEDAPTAVTIFTPFVQDNGSVQVTWTRNDDSDFASYRLFRAEQANVDLSSTLRAIFSDRRDLEFIDTEVTDGVTYFYKIFSFDQSGLSTPSNEVSVTLPANTAPVPVTLAVPSALSQETLKLTWSRSNETDFSHYSVYRSLVSPVDTTQTPIAVLNSSPADTEFTDNGLTTLTTYFYRVFVVDQKGLQAGSNEVSGTTK